MLLEPPLRFGGMLAFMHQACGKVRIAYAPQLWEPCSYDVQKRDPFHSTSWLECNVMFTAQDIAHVAQTALTAKTFS